MWVTGERVAAAEAAFRVDPGWRGGDDAYSIVLSSGRRLWLFGDSFVEPTDGSRATATFIHNSIAIQTGEVLESGSLAFHWRHDEDGAPTSFFADRGQDYLWPGHGAMVGESLLLFFMVTRDRPWQRTSPDQIETLEFFTSHDWDAVVVDNPHDEPGDWVMREVTRPSRTPAPLLGSAGVVVHDGHVYAHAVGHPRAWLARWPAETACKGDLSSPSWWGGDAGWTPDASLAVVVIEPAETEFTVHHDGERFIHTQLLGLIGEGIEIRTAPAPEGPWSAPTVAKMTLASHGHADRFSYAGKAHPGLHVSSDQLPTDLIATHNTITLDLEAIRTNEDLYWPRVIALRR